MVLLCGYSSSQFVRIIGEDVKIDTIELDEERAKQAIQNIKNIGIEKNINVMIGNAVEILPTLEGPYDVIFIDANKGKYPVFLRRGYSYVTQRDNNLRW